MPGAAHVDSIFYRCRIRISSVRIAVADFQLSTEASQKPESNFRYENAIIVWK